MRTIILFNDNSPEAANAAIFAVGLAENVKADILVLDLCKTQGVENKAKALVTAGGASTETGHAGFADSLIDNTPSGDFKPVINKIDASAYNEKDISELVIRKNIWMMVKGIETHVTHKLLSAIDVQAIVNHVACPLLLVPDSYHKGKFKNITYALDMRYCRTAVLRFLAELARDCDANLVIEHFSAKGLPHLHEGYARELFSGEIANKIKYDKVYFNNIKERNLNAAVDVMVNDLRADLLALVNHRFHFEELFGRSVKNVLPEHVPIPVIIFPL